MTCHSEAAAKGSSGGFNCREVLRYAQDGNEPAVQHQGTSRRLKMGVRPAALWAILAALLVSACAPASVPAADRNAPSPRQSPKVVTVGISTDVAAMSIMGTSGIGGGWAALNEVHSEGMVTADRDVRRPVPRLAVQVPSFDNGSMELLSDGRMRTVYRLRQDATWHDGASFTANDMVFSYELNSDRNLPFLSREAIQQMERVEAPDDYTVSILWKAPYYQADSLGLRALWPHPKHILE